MQNLVSNFVAGCYVNITGMIDFVLEYYLLMNPFLRARHYLDINFPNSFGRGGPVAWSARSPNLNPLNYFLWGHLKNFIY